MRLAIIGAGQTGRGFLGRMAFEEGHGIVFIDRDAALVRALQEVRHYTVWFGARAPVRVEGFAARLAGTREAASAIRAADLTLISVGRSNLPEVGRALSAAMPDGECWVVTAENASGASDLLARHVGLPKVRVSQGAVFCTSMHRPGTPLDIDSEAFDRVPMDARCVPPRLPAFFEPVERYDDLLSRKLYTYNCLSAAIAYLGDALGYTDYAPAALDPDIAAYCARVADALERPLCRAFSVGSTEQRAFAAQAMRKFQDLGIRDSVARNTREALRKLSPGERIMGPLALIRQNGGDGLALAPLLGAALRYAAAHEAPDRTPAGLAQDVCGLAAKDPILCAAGLDAPSDEEGLRACLRKGR